MDETAHQSAPILSTTDEHILEDAEHAVNVSSPTTLSDEQLYITYEIDRTVQEIKRNRYRSIALQFPDDMLPDGIRVYERLRQGLYDKRRPSQHTSLPIGTTITSQTTADCSVSAEDDTDIDFEEKLTILGDTSYGACCIDEIAAEHANADVVVHYGRSCLSPTARLPVIYVYTNKVLDHDAVLAAFESTYPDKQPKVVIMADVPFQIHVDTITKTLQEHGYMNLFASTLLHDPSSPLPNRTIPTEVDADISTLSQYSLFHISEPPTALLLNVNSKVSSVHIFPTDVSNTSTAPSVASQTSQKLRRRYALVTRLSTISVFGILINTLSVRNYADVLSRIKDLITAAGKRYYTFVVGKLNAAKVANFAEIEGWVVIGCWESSLIESKDFWKPLITPFELELALMHENERVWTGEWNSDFQHVLRQTSTKDAVDNVSSDTNGQPDADSEEESEPPVYDLRTGRYLSHSRPTPPSKPSANPSSDPSTDSSSTAYNAKNKTALVKRYKGELARINGQLSPAAEYLRTQRTWTGLGSEIEIAYEFDKDGKVRGAPMEEGRTGVASGYTVGDAETSRT